MKHTIRYQASPTSPASWQAWGNIQFPNLPMNFSQSSIDCANIGNELHAVVSNFLGGGGPAGPNIYHTIRQFWKSPGTVPSINWTPWQPLAQAIKGEPQSYVEAPRITCAGAGQELHVFAVDYSHELLHTRRLANGQWDEWEANWSKAPISFPIDVFDAAGAGADIHIIVEGGRWTFDDFGNRNIPKIWHTVLSNGKWQDDWGDVSDTVPGGAPANFLPSSVACAGVGSDLHVVAWDSYSGDLWHTIRFGINGSWTSWGDVSLAIPTDNPKSTIATNLPFHTHSFKLNFHSPTISCAGVGNDLHLVVVDQYTGYVWHTIRFANGDWQVWELATQHIPLSLNNQSYTPLGSGFGCAGVGSELHIVG